MNNPNSKNPFQRLQSLAVQLVSNSHEEVSLKQTKKWTKAIAWALMGGTVFAIGWLAIAETEEIVVAPGKLEPLGGVIDVQMPLQGIAKSIEVKEGEYVKKGQLLIQLDKEVNTENYTAIAEALRLKQKELEFKNQELNAELSLSDIKIESLNKSLILSKNIQEKFKILNDQGATAELQYLEQKDKVQRILGEIKTEIGNKKRKQSILEQNIRSIRSQIADIKSKLSEATVTLRYKGIKSPVDGIVFDLKVLSKGFVARTSEPILKIVPLDKLQASVEVESRSIGYIRVGIPADISIDSYPATDFGVIEGEVTQIGSDALPPEPSSAKGYRFPTIIALDSQELKQKNGNELPLQVGMSLTANIKLRKVTYLQLLLGSFRDKADSLREL